MERDSSEGLFSSFAAHMSQSPSFGNSRGSAKFEYGALTNLTYYSFYLILYYVMLYYIILYYVTLYITHDIDFISCYYVIATCTSVVQVEHLARQTSTPSQQNHKQCIKHNSAPTLQITTPPFSMGNKYIAQYMSSMVK